MRARPTGLAVAGRLPDNSKPPREALKAQMAGEYCQKDRETHREFEKSLWNPHDKDQGSRSAAENVLAQPRRNRGALPFKFCDEGGPGQRLARVAFDIARMPAHMGDGDRLPACPGNGLSCSVFTLASRSVA